MKQTVQLLGWSILLTSLLHAQARNDVYIHVGMGDSLDATYFVPPTPPPGTGYPGILFVHGYGFDKFEVLASCSTYALSGYVTMCYSVRGHGNSSGGSTIMSTRERADLREVLSYFNSLANIDTTAIGISGGSQGGLHGLWAATDRLPVNAVTADVIVPHWASDMLGNGCVRRTLLLLLQNNAVRYDTVRSTFWNFIRADNFDSLSTQFPVNRDLDTARLNSSTVPTLRLLKWQDHYFSAEDGINAFQNYSGPKKIYIGARGHFSDQVESERVYQYDQVTRWLNYFLKGQQNGILTDPMYTYAYSSLPMDSLGYFKWTRVGVHSWPPSGIIPTRFYLHADSTLSSTPTIGGNDSLVLQNNYLNPLYTFDTAYVEGFKGSRFDIILPKSTFAFTSSLLQTDVQWIGTPAMKLSVRSDVETFPLHAQIYEVDTAGRKYFVNRINFTARHWAEGAKGIVDVKGTPHAHTFMKGNRIRIELTNIDKTNRLLLGEYPFVVPVFKQASATIFLDASHPSYIELPLVGTPTDVRSYVSELPATNSLDQNYPNPFNPTTDIRYQISNVDNVKIKIYDILGREIITLVNEKKQPGTYTVTWDASYLPSGVYFYRLQTNNTGIVKKMLLLK